MQTHQLAMTKLLTVFILLPLFCVGQKQGNIWYFGNHAGLDFNNGSPVTISDGQTYLTENHTEGTSVICDSSGALLFYTNGVKVWNRNHEIMLNGDSILSSYSSTQSSLIIPLPGSNHLFYLFTTDGFYDHSLEYGFRYSEIDMCLDNEFGAVILDKKNILLLDTVAEKLTAVRHANNTDYWVLVHKYFSDAFYAFLFTGAGITDTVITHIGSIHNGTTPDPTFAAMGYMKASHDGRKVAIVNMNPGGFVREILDFDNATGVFSNCIDLHTIADMNEQGGYGVSFSPDNTKLYLSLNAYIYQYNLSAGSGDPEAIRNSKIRVDTTYNHNGNYALALGPDDKIYVTMHGYKGLSVIDNPNATGILCNYIDSAINLGNGICNFGLPNFIDSYDYSNTTVSCSTISIQEENYLDNVSAFPNPFTNQTTLQTDKVFKDATMTLYNSLGQQVRQVNNISGQTATLHRDNLPSGLYYLQLTQDNQTIATDKLVITD